MRSSSVCRLAATLLSSILAAGPCSSLAGQDAPPAPKSTAATSMALETLDVDGDGAVDPLTDGLLVLRYLFGLRGASLVQGVVGIGAARTTPEQIEPYLGGLASTYTQTLPAGCSVNAFPTSTAASPLPPGTQVQMTASCTIGMAPVNFVWSYVGAGGLQGPSLSAAPTSTTVYTVMPQNAFGFGTPFGTVVYAGSGTLLPSSCVLLKSANGPVAAGTTVDLSVYCAGGLPPTSCAWNNGIASTACKVSVAPNVTTTYAATPANDAGATAPIGATVIATGGDGTNYCTGSDQIIDVAWPAGGTAHVFTSNFANQRIAFRLPVPTTFDPPLNIGHIGAFSIHESPGAPVVSRDITVSYNACDFQSGNHLWSVFGDNGQSAYFTANNPLGYAVAGGNFNINSGENVYINVRNASNGVPSCLAGSCDALFTLLTPNRY